MNKYPSKDLAVFDVIAKTKYRNNKKVNSVTNMSTLLTERYFILFLSNDCADNCNLETELVVGIGKRVFRPPRREVEYLCIKYNSCTNASLYTGKI